MIILFFGQPSSGKTTLANEFFSSLIQNENPHISVFACYNLFRIDGDDWRNISENKDYSKEGRVANLKSAFSMAKLLEKEGFVPVLSFVAPYQELREFLGDGLVQIYLECDTDRGKSEYFVPDFEQPENKYLSLNTSNDGIEICIKKITDFIKGDTPMPFTRTKNGVELIDLPYLLNTQNDKY